MAPLAESSSSGPEGNVLAVPSVSMSCCCTEQRMGSGYPICRDGWAVSCSRHIVLLYVCRGRQWHTSVIQGISSGFLELINDFLILAVGQTAQRCSEDVAGNGCKVLMGPQLILQQWLPEPGVLLRVG